MVYCAMGFPSNSKNMFKITLHCFVYSSLFMFAVVLTSTANLNVDHLTAGIILLLCVSGLQC